MKEFTYYAPTEIIFGKDKRGMAGRLCKQYGASRVFVVYGGKSAVQSGLLAEVEKSLKEAGLEVCSMGGVVPNPLLSKAVEMINAAKEFKADFILAVGGGSVIDTAKAVAHGTANPNAYIWDIWEKKVPLEKSLPHAAIVTIAAAGSETSDSAVLTNDLAELTIKRGLGTKFNRCAFTIMDPTITMTLPKWQIGAGAADIFMHTAERFFSPVSGNHLSDGFAVALFKNIIEFGPKMVQNPSDYEAASEVMWSGSISHIGLTGLGSGEGVGREGDWSCHQLGMAISAIFDHTHGATLSAIYGAWARYVIDAGPGRFAQFAREVFDVKETDDMKAGLAGIELTEKFFVSLGMPVTLSGMLGHEPTEEDIDAISTSCSWGKTRTIGTFKTLDHNDIVSIFKSAK